MQLGQATRDEQVPQEVGTLQHLLGNQIGLAAGRAQLLSLAPELPPALRPAVSEIADAALAAARTLQRLWELTSPAQLEGPSTAAAGDRASAAPSPQSLHGAPDCHPLPLHPFFTGPVKQFTEHHCPHCRY